MNKVLKSIILPFVFLVSSSLIFTSTTFACGAGGCGYNGYHGYNGNGYNGGYGGGVRYVRVMYIDGCCNKNYVTYKKWCRYVKRCYTDCCGCTKTYYTRQNGCVPVRWVIKYRCNYN